ncbi:hypothetical protein [Xenorhabdus innexi]|uniref:Uncharacterized protein n=1 Tax=Xenorhabdus innexi TaxID=290109 RepID=A0A1N6N194_9GAMM|nr:hypothetical protein [Xenorhabdus innexi]PHM31341.1 hypothetical protein Xinn_02887 [Xenorhabdus innexi]SIP74792.1 hypothetical protein XIS1_840061 [Xenorhabdus innexi]
MSTVGSVNGVYISEDLNYTLTVTDNNPSPGIFKGSFVSHSTLTGGVNYDEIFGQYRFVADDQQWPAQISFYSILTASPRKHVIADSWNGIRTADGNIIMSGVRTYTTKEGLYDIYTFEKIIFKLTPTT